LCENEFKALGCRVKVATEDGSKGKKGLATDLLRTTHDAQRTTIYACGPRPMLKAVARISSAMGVPCQVSMEEKMACGVGVCLGCPVKARTAYSERRTASVQYAQRTTQYEYKIVCKDGPVFDAKEIAW
jgi:dihydroorotate dehydrogenase electron transfer subunit